MEGIISSVRGLSTSNAVDYGIWTTHESNAAFPVTRHQYRMICDKDILQLSFEDLNQSMSPLKISYHYISSVTVSSSNRHPVCASCMLPRHVLLGHLDPWRRDRLVIPKGWKVVQHFMLHTIPEDSRSQNMFNFSVSFHQKKAKWWIYIYSVTLLQKMPNRVKSHDLPHQAIGHALSTQHCCSSFKSFFISKNHQTWGFHLLIPHKQNPHTDQPACCNC